MMDSWILQGGHPIVSVGRDTLSQSPFSYGPPTPARRAPSARRGRSRSWSAPSTALRASASCWGADRGAAPGGRGGQRRGWGVYRLSYDDLSPLAGRLGDLDPLERSNLFADTWALVLAGRAELRRSWPSPPTSAARASRASSPWSPAPSACATAPPRRRRAMRWRRPPGPCSARRSARLGWDRRDGEGERIPTIRALVLGSLGTIGADPAVRAEAARRFDAARPSARLDPDIEGAVLAVVADQLRPGDYETILDRYRHRPPPKRSCAT